MDLRETGKSKIKKITKTVKLSDVEPHIIKNAISKINFFQFKNFNKYFPSIQSINELLGKKEFLPELNIQFVGVQEDLDILSNKQIFSAVYSLLMKISETIKGNLVDYIGSSEFKPNQISNIFYDKRLRLEKGSRRSDGEIAYLSDKDWYAFNANYGTDEEKACVKLIERLINENLNHNFNEIYLLRNELHFRIFNFDDGQAFAPDFVLLLKNKKGDSLVYQIFIEPKGEHLKEVDEWKEKFLLTIEEKFLTTDIGKFVEALKHKVIGLPFYNKQEENKFKDSLFEVLK
ncbi:MAG: hypothetical protein GPJ52_00010 [Candidatus Heimdallarchaeota archaeon]|nr:hypothetical protein [Candidatus Heimdallarchaeota archaeon]